MTWTRTRGASLALILLATSPGPAQVQEERGLVVERVPADSAAAKAGLAAGDRVLTYNDTPLPSPAAFQAVQDNTAERAEAVLRVHRAGVTRTVTAPRAALQVDVRPE